MAFFRLGLAFALTMGTLAFAADSVWVRSEVCATHAGLTTSGVPILFHGKSYVLTSSWGILEEEKGNCFEVGDDTARSYPATLAALDASVGYALLEVPGLQPSLELDSFTAAQPSSPDFSVAGYAGGKAEEKKGRVVASHSTRHHLAALPFTFEMTAERMGSSFAGAPVYGKTLDGIVSGQWIEVVAGTFSRIREFKSAGTETPNHFFVIPIALIRKQLANGFPKPAMRMTAAEKLGDRQAMLAGKQKFQITCPAGAGLPPKDGIGPIGGGDGVGVGGTMKGAETCTMRVTLQKEAALETPAFFPAAFAQDLEKSLKPGQALLVPFLSTRNVSGDLARVAFFSMPHFFSELAKGKRFWVLAPEVPIDWKGGTPLEELFLENRKLKQILLDTYPLISSREDERETYRVVYTHVIITDSLNWNLMKQRDWFAIVGKAGQFDFAKGVTWQGRPLRDILDEKLRLLDRLYFKTGGTW